MRRAEERVLVIAAVLLSSALSLFPFPPSHVAADPWTVNNPDGTSDAVWNFTTPADYTLTSTAISAGVASLNPQFGSWNSTTSTDFSSPDSSTNIELTKWPGNVAMGSTSGTPTALIFQPGAAGEDAYLDGGNKNLNHGADTTMLSDGRGATDYRPILRFDLSTIPAGAVIDEAILGLYETNGINNPFTADVHQLTTAWNETTVTWNTPWTSAGGDYSSHVFAQMVLNNTVGWKTANITQLVDLWYRGRIPNYGLLLWPTPTPQDSDKTFASSDNGVAIQRPKLTITYRILGATGEYISKVGGPGTLTNWQNISWNFTDRSFASDEFSGPALDPKWAWTNPPASYDVGTTTPGSLHLVSSTSADLNGATFTGNVLSTPVVGDFTATMQLSANPTVSGQKSGLMVLLDNRDWYAVYKVNVAGSVNWQVRQTADAASTTPVSIASGNPIPAWLRIQRAGNAFTASTSPDGFTWTAQNSYTPTFEYPMKVKVALFAADGLSGTALSIDVGYVRVTLGSDATATIQTRAGDVTPVDGTWTSWTLPYPSPSGSPMSGKSRYIEFRLYLSVTYPDHTPNIGDVNISYANYASSGVLETMDFVPAELAAWNNFTVTDVRNGQTIAYEYSTNSGGSWTTISPPVNLAAVSTASGKIRFRASFATTDTTVSPTISEMRLTYRHSLDHFDATASAGATAGAAFSVTVIAKDASNNTITGWTGTVALASVLMDGITPGGGLLGTASLAVVSGGTATLTTETYTKAETIRILASYGSATGLSGGIVVSPGSLDHIILTPNDVTLVPFEVQILSAAGYDAWNNSISGLTFTWSVTGGVGTLNTTSGRSVTFTASSPAANGTAQATSGAVVGIAQIHIVNGARPWVVITSPSSGAHLTAAVTIRYTNSSDSTSLVLEYNAGAGWTTIVSTGVLNGAYVWDTAGLNFTGGGLRATVENAALLTNVSLVTPIEVDNAPPMITLGTVTDDQGTTGTLTLAYTTSADVVRVDFTYFDGTWHPIGADTTVDGTYVWTPGIPINGVTVRVVATDEVNLTGWNQKMGVGTHAVGTNPPTILAIPQVYVHVGSAYALNLTFYVSDPDTPRSALVLWDSDATNVTTLASTYPSLSITYAATGTYEVTLWASDGTDTAWTILSIVASATSPPAPTQNLPSVTFDEDTIALNAFRAALTTFFTDPDGDPLTFAVLDGANVSARVNSNGTVDLSAGANWSGAEILRVRASDPSSGFAESAFLVTVRSVDDPPALAAIPAITMGAGSSYRLDLTSYVSDVDNNLVDLIVTTNNPYVSVNGFVLTLAFPSDWTQASFTITVSDGVAVASETVQVTIIPIPPAWWQSPYLFAIAPAGILVVVAMFAQRARWRPAKAFLVDERGQLLREFTLDASCQVTYDQVYQAGALDAVEKAVKVSKYRAQTVRGDALAVVLLAYGPVTLEQVEFAREMLVNVQDKFDESVKQRLEDARAYETELDTVRERLEANRNAFAVQSQTFGGMVDAITTAQVKMAAESASIRAKVLDVTQREDLLKEDRTALNELARQLEEQRASIDARTAEMRELEADYAARMESLRSREARIGPAETALAGRESALAERGMALQAKSDDLARQDQEIQASLQSLEERMVAVGRDRDMLEKARAQFTSEQHELLEFRDSLDARVAEVQTLEADAATQRALLDEREARLGPQEADLSRRESSFAEHEKALRIQADEFARMELELKAFKASLEESKSKMDRDRSALEAARATFESDQKELLKFKASVDTRVAEVGKAEEDVAEREQNLDERETRIAPVESDLKTRDVLLKQAEERVRLAAEKATAEHLEAMNLKKSLEERQTALARERALVEDTRRALGDQGREFEARIARFEEEARLRKADLDEQAKYLGEQQLKLAKDKDVFEATRTEKSQWIASKEIELEAREQTLQEKETAVRAQAEENAKQLAELAGREEAIEIEGDKIDKARAETETRKADLDKQAKALEAKAAQLRDEEVKKAEEYRTWQATLESEQALLKQQKETFEKETSELRESWAGRMLRLQMREEDVGQREEKIRADVEWVARNEEDLKRREKVAEDALKSANEAKVEVEKVRKELAQRAFELEARERALREEAAKHADELATRDRALKVSEAELAEKRAQFDHETTARGLQLQQIESELSRKQQALDSKAAELSGQEARLASRDAALREEDQRLVRERTDLQALGQQLEARQVELTQARLRNEEETARLRVEMDAFRQSVATKEADLRSERERVERDSTALQEKLGVKAQELAAREKALSARESELRAEEADLEAHLREIESRERQAQAHAAELNAQATTLAKRQQDLDTRAAHLDETAKKLTIEEAQKRQEWENLRNTLKYQEQQLAASTEERFAEVARRMAELETREKALTTAMAQVEVQRAKLADAAKAQAAKDAEAAAAWSRSEKRFSELKAMEADLLNARQAFETERTAWATHRGEELKQLEMTRDASAEQAQQAERLIADAQRRALVASEAEKAARRQGEELAGLQKQFEARRADAEKAEKAAETRMAQLNEAIRKFTTNEMALAEKVKDQEAREAKLAASATEAARVAEELKAKRAEFDLESARQAKLAADIEARKADADTRVATAEAKKADLVQRERVLTTELQRAENLMEDLNRKEGEVKTREKTLSGFETELAKRETALGAKDAELREGMQALARMRQDLETKMGKIDTDLAAATANREEAIALKAESDKAKGQADEMQKEVSKNMKFLQKKAVDVLDREERIREREVKVEDDEKSLGARAEILEQKEKALEAEREEIVAKMERMRTEADKLRARLTDAEKAGKSGVDIEDWKKDIENRVKIIQKKAMELLDREENLRKKEEELRALAQQLGVQS